MLALLSLIASEGGEAKEVVNPVIPDTPELVWGAIAFFLLLILMYAVCLPPIRQAMRRREDQMRNDAESAERARVEAEQVRRDYDATLAEARRAEIIRAAKDDAAAERQAALADLDAARTTALDGLRPQVGSIAVAAAGKVVQRDLDVAANQSVVDEHVRSASRG